MVEPVFQKINVTIPKEKITEQIKVDSKTQVASGEVGGILSVSPFVTTQVLDEIDGKIKYGGKAVFYISFIDADKNIRKCECGSEFQGEMASPCDSCKVSLSSVIEKAEADTTGSFLGVSAVISVVAETVAFEQTDALIGGEELIVKEEEISVLKPLGVRKASYPVEQDFEVDYAVEEVLFHRADAVVTAAQCGVGTIIVDGEVLFASVLLQKNQKQDIIKENKSVPFRFEIECEEAMPGMQAIARVKENSFKTDVAVDDESAKSTITEKANLSFEGEAVLLESITVAQDVFSAEKDLDAESGLLKIVKACELRGYTISVSGKAATGELPASATVLSTCCEKVSVTDFKVVDNGVLVLGVLTVTILLKDGDGRVFSRKAETPFEKLLEAEFNPCTSVSVTAKAVKSTARIVSIDEFEVFAELRFTVYPQERTEKKFVKGVKVLGDKKKCDAAISVYIPTEGEDLWSLSKRLGVCPDALVQTNKDLQFPLSGKERIVVYRRK